MFNIKDSRCWVIRYHILLGLLIFLKLLLLASQSGDRPAAQLGGERGGPRNGGRAQARRRGLGVHKLGNARLRVEALRRGPLELADGFRHWDVFADVHVLVGNGTSGPGKQFIQLVLVTREKEETVIFFVNDINYCYCAKNNFEINCCMLETLFPST